MATVRLETPSRYYLCVAQQDLFGGWELFRVWGGKGSRLGNAMHEPAGGQAHAADPLQKLVRAKAGRGYKVVDGQGRRAEDE